DFDAVVVNGGDSLEPALTICSSLRRNTRLYHTPSLLMVDIDAFDDADAAFERGVSDILPDRAPPAELASRIISLARERRRRESIKAAFAQARSPQVTDEATGLVSPAFFCEHLDAMARRAAPIARPLSLVVLHASAPRDVEGEPRAQALRQLGSMVRHLMRVEDLGARLDAGVFVIAMPGSERGAAEDAARRLEAVAECTAFDGGQGAPPFQLQIDAAVAQLDPDEAGRALLARAVRRFEGRARAS
ncbi:MAG: GGDEF domain-containing protein, partial [Caulobacterales bacterium]|nr:GGDEF domain-containing protein [Caulobacterales bacterium]